MNAKKDVKIFFSLRRKTFEIVMKMCYAEENHVSKIYHELLSIL